MEEINRSEKSDSIEKVYHDPGLAYLLLACLMEKPMSREEFEGNNSIARLKTTEFGITRLINTARQRGDMTEENGQFTITAKGTQSLAEVADLFPQNQSD